MPERQERAIDVECPARPLLMRPVTYQHLPSSGVLHMVTDGLTWCGRLLDRDGPVITESQPHTPAVLCRVCLKAAGA